MDEHGKITLYLSYRTEKGLASVTGKPYSFRSYWLGNWPGSIKIIPHHVRKGRHNIAGTRYDVWFTDHKNRQWHGVQYGENTQLCHCKRLKA